MPKPVCVKCKQFFRPKLNGIAWEEGMPIKSQNRLPDQSLIEVTDWKSYKLWMGDLWECQGCGAELVLTGAAQVPVGEHFQKDYQQLLETFRPKFLVKDC